MLRIVKRSINVANQSALTEDQYGDRAKDWANELILIVPFDRLWQSFDQAFIDRTTNYPISALDIKLAWEKLRQKESAARMEALRANPVEECEKRGEHFREVGDDGDGGLIEIVLGGLTPNPRTVIIPCDECRTYENRIRFAEEKAKYARDFPALLTDPEIALPKIFADMKGKVRTVPETDIEILDRAIHQIQNEPFDRRFRKFDIYAAVRSLHRAKEWLITGTVGG